MPLTDDHDDGWLGFLAPAAVLWLAGAMFAVTDGWACRWQHSELMARGPARISIAVLGVVLAAGLVSRLIRPWLAELWLGRHFERLLQGRLRRRQERWDEASDAAIRNRIALARPVSATWMGDRIASLETRVRNEYGLDFAAAWPRLCLVLPEPCLAELRAAAHDWRRSTAWGAWAVLYALLAVLWLPLLALAMLTFAMALQSARRAVARLTDLAESAVDLYGADLAERLGFDVPGREVTPEIGRKVTVRLRKSG